MNLLIFYNIINIYLYFFWSIKIFFFSKLVLILHHFIKKYNKKYLIYTDDIGQEHKIYIKTQEQKEKLINDCLNRINFLNKIQRKSKYNYWKQLKEEKNYLKYYIEQIEEF